MTDRRIVIIGGGFAGVNLAKKLSNERHIQVTLVDRNNYNFFQPLLYQVATGVLDTSSICAPFRSVFKNVENLTFRLGELLRVVPEDNRIVLTSGELVYDDLIIATGTKSNFFGMEDMSRNALPLKTMDDAIGLRNHLIGQAERYTYIEDEAERRKIRNIVVLGAGPSGVEVAGMIASMTNRILNSVYPEFDHTKMNLYLVDGASAVLPPMREASRTYARKTLEERGVKVLLSKMATGYADDVVTFEDGDTIETKTLVWAAGVTAPPFDGLPEGSYGKGGRLAVDEHNMVAGSVNIYAIGDACVQKTDPAFPDGHPQLASVAKQQGKRLAENLQAKKNGTSLKAFRYRDLGSMAIVGRHSAVADLTTPHLTLKGWPAWASWLFLHLFLLISYRNRFRTLWNWTNSIAGKAQSQQIMLGRNSIGTGPDGA